MELEMDRQLIQGIWGYHWWGNRTHFDEVAALGEETARQEVGEQFSAPTLKGMLAHIYGADRIWFERCGPSAAPGLQVDRRQVVQSAALAAPPARRQPRDPPP
jgi:uncharacterized damage-inducible protein DinB